MYKKTISILATALSFVLFFCGCGGAADIEVPSAYESNDTASLGKIHMTPEEASKSLSLADSPVFESSQIRGVSVVSKGEVRYQLNFNPREDREYFLFWDIISPYESTGVVDTEVMYQLFDILASIRLNNTIEGLEFSDSGSYILVNLSGINGDKEADSPDATFTLHIGQETDEGVACLVNDSENPILVDKFAVLSLMSMDPFNLLLKIPYVVSISSIEEVYVTFDGKSHILKVEGGEYTIDNKKADENQFMELYGSLMQPLITGEKKEDFEGEKKEVLSMEYFTKDGVENHSVKIFKEGDNYAIRVNEKEFFYVDGEEVEALKDTLKKAF